MSPVNKPPVASLSGTNLEFARSHNRRVVMEAIRLHGRLTRADIARLTALTPQTISNIASELQKLGFLNALAPERGTRGQPATPFVINPDGAYSIGLQIDQNMMVAVVVDLSGKIRGRCTLAVDHPTPAQALPLVRDVVETLRKSSDADWSRVLGLGLAVPGPFDVEGLSAVGPTALPGWQDLSIAQQIGTAIGLPVIMENDATAAAIGERLHGVARTFRSFTYLFIGTGLGAGMFHDGHLYKGSGHNAGEIGHMIVVPDGRQCPCGNRGCLERYVSLQAAYEALEIGDLAHATPQMLLDPSPAARAPGRLARRGRAAAAPGRQHPRIDARCRGRGHRRLPAVVRAGLADRAAGAAAHLGRGTPQPPDPAGDRGAGRSRHRRPRGRRAADLRRAQSQSRRAAEGGRAWVGSFF